MFFYQGETIPIYISGDAEIDLSYYDFVMLVYPNYNQENVLEYRKSDFEKSNVDGITTFKTEISYEITKELPVGDYVIEIMVSEYNGYRSVYQKSSAFTLKFSNAKNIVL